MIRIATVALALILPTMPQLAQARAADPVKPADAASKRAKGMPPKVAPGAGHRETPQEQLSDEGEMVVEQSHGHTAKDSEGHMEPNILAIQPSLMATTIIVFAVLLGILWRFAWGPLSKALADRERQQEETLKAAEHSRAESERLLLEHRKQMDATAEQVRQMLEDARRQAEANANVIVEKARGEAEAEAQRAAREIGTARDQALVEIWTRAADTAVAVAGKVLSKEMNPEDHRRLIAAAADALPAAPVGANGHGGVIA